MSSKTGHSQGTQYAVLLKQPGGFEHWKLSVIAKLPKVGPDVAGTLGTIMKAWQALLMDLGWHVHLLYQAQKASSSIG